MTMNDEQVDQPRVGDIVITGNPVDGLIFYGPFTEDSDPDLDAAGWAEANLPGADWWVAPLYEAD